MPILICKRRIVDRPIILLYYLAFLRRQRPLVTMGPEHPIFDIAAAVTT